MPGTPFAGSIVLGVVVLVSSTAAIAEPTRVIVADADPELRRALDTALAPWRFDIVYAPPPPADTTDADARARAEGARFVVWRREGDLVVYDRERGAAEHREGPRGKLDAASAAASALTVKTLMRLPPPKDPDVVVEPPPPSPPPLVEPGGPEVRLQTALASRVARGSTTELGGRIVLAALVRPWADRGWRFGVAGDLGTDANVQSSGFKGTWTDWAVLGVASWSALVRPNLELGPHVAVGVARSVFEGNEQMELRSEAATMLSVRAGMSLRWRFGMWTIGPAVELDAFLGTPTYTKRQGSGDLFRVPPFAIVIGALGAIDLGR